MATSKRSVGAQPVKLQPGATTSGPSVSENSLIAVGRIAEPAVAVPAARARVR